MATSSSSTAASSNVLGQTAVEEAFSNNSVREKILRLVIYDKGGAINRQNVCYVRVVRKSWLKTTTKLLRDSMVHVITLNLNSDNCHKDAALVKKDGKRLDQFVGRFTAAENLPESSLPFKLDIVLDYFHEENYESLMTCLTRLGNHLMEIQVEYPSDGGTMPVSFPQLTLPLLRKLSFQFSSTPLPRRQQNDDTGPRFGDNRNGLWLLQSILNGSNHLKVFTVTGSSENVIPMGFEYLRLPESVSSIQLRMPMKTKHWNILMKNNLPNCTTFLLEQNQIEEDMLFNILKTLGRTLTNFNVQRPCQSRPCPRTFLRFPVMENLETIKITNSNYELGPTNVSALENCFPKLKHLGLMDQSGAMLLKWVQNSKFESVVCLGLSVTDEQFDRRTENYYRSPCEEIMAQIDSAFPKVRVLNLHLSLRDLNCLNYLFKNMQRIKILQIVVQGGLEADSGDLLDSAMLGIPIRMVTVLKEDSEFFEAFVLKRDRQPTIMNLTGLEELILLAPDFHEGGGRSLMSDLLFSQGLMKIRKLRKLFAYGRFKPSSRMQNEWKEQGRFLKYSPRK